MQKAFLSSQSNFLEEANDGGTNSKMPIVKVLMYGGRSQQQKDDLARAITDAVESIAKAPRDQTIVVIQEVAKEHYYIGAKRSS